MATKQSFEKDVGESNWSPISVNIRKMALQLLRKMTETSVIRVDVQDEL
jgi:hypothetical protein